MRRISAKCLYPMAFLVGLVAVHFALSHAFSTAVGRTDREFSRDRRFLQHVQPFDFVVMGDSHPMMLREEHLGNAANLAYLGEGYMITYYKLAALLKRRPDLFKTVVIPLDPHSFTGALDQFTADSYRAQYVDYFELARRNGNMPEYLRQFIKYRAFPYSQTPTTLYKNLPARREQRARESEQLRNSVFTQTHPDPKANARERAQAHFAGRNLIEPEQAFYLERILSLCHERKIRVILVRFPLSRVYIETAESHFTLDEFDRAVAPILKRWPETIVLDYTKSFINDDTLFLDADHINVNGSRVLATMLLEDMAKARASTTNDAPRTALTIR